MKQNISKKKPTLAFISFSLDDYNLSLENAIHDYAKTEDFNFLVFLTSYAGHSESIEEITNNISRLITQHCVDGLIIPSSALNSYFPWDLVLAFIESFNPLPVVLIGNEVKNYPCVIEDNKTGMTKLMRHIIEYHGFRRIAFIRGPYTSYEADERFAAYQDTLAEYDIPYDESIVVSGDFDFKTIADSTIRALNIIIGENTRELDAIVCSSDKMAYSVINELTKKGISVPNEIAVTGFDNSEICTMMFPPMTTIDQNRDEQARTAAKILLRKLNDENYSETIEVRTNLIIRRSCGCFIHPNEISVMDINHKTDDNIITHAINYLENDRKLAELSRKNNFNWKEKTNLILNELLKMHPENKTNPTQSLEAIIIQDIRRHGNYDIWNYLLSRLGMIATSFPGISAEQHYKFFYSIMQIVATTAKTLNLIKFMDLRNEEFLLHSMIESFISCREFTEFTEILSEYLPKLGMISCYICLYNENNNAEANLLFGYNSRLKKKFMTDGRYFPSYNLVPDFIDLFEDRSTFIVKDLLSQNEFCGYILFERGEIGSEIQAEIYGSLANQISTVISQINLHKQINDYSKSLEIKVQERTSQISETNERLKKLDSVKNDFIANITHDFRSPLTVILNIADIELKFKEDSPCQKHFEMILASAYRMKHFIDRLLDLAKLDSNAAQLHVTKININEFIKNVAGYYTKSTSATNINISINMPDAPRDDFYSDEEKLDEIISNIISNAIKHVDSETGRIDISVEYIDDEFCRISIADNGTGIPEENLEEIFDRFKQLESGRNTRFGGTGIGLAFAKQLTEFMKGKIWAESAGLGKGSVFRIQLPLGENFGSSEIAPRQRTSSFDQNMRKTLAVYEMEQKLQKDILTVELANQYNEEKEDIRNSLILIADDEAQIGEIIKNYLSKNGFKNFLIATGGHSAIRALESYSPDIIICDYNMPEINGNDVLKHIIEDPEKKDTPFIFLSAIADEKIIDKQMTSGAREYLKKPIVEKELIRTVEYYLEKYHKLRSTPKVSTGDSITHENAGDDVMQYINKIFSVRKWIECSFVMMKVIFEESILSDETKKLYLEKIHNVLSEILRGYDMFKMLDNDIFFIALPHTTRDNSEVVTEKITDHITNISMENPGMINFFFGISSLGSDKNSLTKDLQCESVENYFNIKEPQTADWEKIGETKNNMVLKLRQYAEKALQKAVSENIKTIKYSDMI